MQLQSTTICSSNQLRMLTMIQPGSREDRHHQRPSRKSTTGATARMTRRRWLEHDPKEISQTLYTKHVGETKHAQHLTLRMIPENAEKNTSRSGRGRASGQQQSALTSEPASAASSLNSIASKMIDLMGPSSGIPSIFPIAVQETLAAESSKPDSSRLVPFVILLASLFFLCCFHAVW